MPIWFLSMTLEANYSEHSLHIRSSSCDWSEEKYMPCGKTAGRLVDLGNISGFRFAGNTNNDGNLWQSTYCIEIHTLWSLRSVHLLRKKNWGRQESWREYTKIRASTGLTACQVLAFHNIIHILLHTNTINEPLLIFGFEELSESIYSARVGKPSLSIPDQILERTCPRNKKICFSNSSSIKPLGQLQVLRLV